MSLVMAVMFSSLLLGICLVQLRKGDWQFREDRLITVLGCIFSLTTVTLLLSPIWMEYAGAGGTVVVYNDNGKVEAANPMALPCWSNCIDISNTTEFKRVLLSGRVKPITDNPKVRDLSYSGYFWIEDPKSFFESERDCLLRVIPAQSSQEDTTRCLTARVEYYLYEMNNAHSKELALFYNPRDPQQVVRLDALIKDNIAAPLKEHGIRYAGLYSFDVQ